MNVTSTRTIVTPCIKYQYEYIIMIVGNVRMTAGSNEADRNRISIR